MGKGTTTPQQRRRPNDGAQGSTGHRYLFVGGLHRSGTTLLAEILATHENVAGLRGTGVTENEGHWLHREFPSVESYGGPGRFAFDSRSHLVDESLPLPEESRRRIENAWRPFWSPADAPVRVEKSPQNLIQSRLLQQVFPGSAFVMVARHPVAVAFATQKWTSIGPVTAPRVLPHLPVHHLVRHWLAAWEQFDNDRIYLENVTVVRFEDLMADPATSLGHITAATGMANSFDLSRITPLASVYQARYEAWKRSVGGRLAARTWMPRLEPSLNRFGYSFSDELV